MQNVTIFLTGMEMFPWRFSTNIYTLQTYWEVFPLNYWRSLLKILGDDPKIVLQGVQWNYWDIFCKNTKRCSENMLGGLRSLKNFLQNYRNIFRKNTYTWSTWEVFRKNTERCFAKVLKGVCQNWWGEFYIHTKNEQPPCKNSVTWVVSS